MLAANDLILFQGDSITECGRDKSATEPNVGLGCGYAAIAAGMLLALNPRMHLRFLNRGEGGNRITHLLARWKADCLNLKPNVVSILIGVNDIWHEFSGGAGTSPQRFERYYRDLLEDTRAALPNVRLVLCTPFVLRCGVVEAAWLPVVAQFQAIVRVLAAEYDARLVNFQGLFEEAVKHAPPMYWASDGVHPTLAGHFLMAQTWVRTVAGGSSL